jgi:hypothetical protein
MEVDKFDVRGFGICRSCQIKAKENAALQSQFSRPYRYGKTWSSPSAAGIKIKK